MRPQAQRHSDEDLMARQRPAAGGVEARPSRVAACEPSGSAAKGAVSAPLARQAASLGSLDFLKLLEAGPNGEPLSFAEVLASNPDWADQHADQSVECSPPGGARALDSARNPGGGAEPANGGNGVQGFDRSLLDEALKLTGPLHAGETMTSSAGQPARLLAPAGPSDSFGDLLKLPSLSTQISKDPSFSSAVFHSLLSQRSDDQAMLLNMLGIEQQQPSPPKSAQKWPPEPDGQQSQKPEGGPLATPPAALARTRHAIEAGRASGTQPQRARNVRDVGASPLSGREFGGAIPTSDGFRQNWQGSGLAASASLPLEAMPIDLPRFSEELEAAQQPPLAMSRAAEAPMAQPQRLAPPAVPRHGVAGDSILDGKVVAPQPGGSMRLAALPMQRQPERATPWPTIPNAREPPQQPLNGAAARSARERSASPLLAEPPKLLDERVASLDYMLASATPSSQALGGARPAHAARASATPHREAGPASPAFPLLSPISTPEQIGMPSRQAANRRGPMPGLGARPPSGAHVPASYHGTVLQTPQFRAALGLPPLASPPGQRGQVHTGKDSGEPARSQDASGGTPTGTTAPEIATSAGGQEGEVRLVAASCCGALGCSGARRLSAGGAACISARSSEASAAARSSTRPAAEAGTYQLSAEAEREDQASAQSKEAHDRSQATANGNAWADPSKSKFLSGLMTGIAPRPASGPPPTPAMQLPKTYVTPLPPLPGVPSIEEYHRKISTPAIPAATAMPRLQVLPLVGTSMPQVAPVKLEFAALHPGVQSTDAQWHAQTAPSSAQPPGAMWPLRPPRPHSAGPEAVPRHGPSRHPAPANGLHDTTSAPHSATKVTSPGAHLSMPSSLSDATSSGSGSAAITKRGWDGASPLLAKRLAISSASLEAQGSDDMQDDTGDEGAGGAGLDRKALRKAKNRASAAASRARREAYTSSLEEEVKRLQRGQEWLRAQLDELGGGEGVTTPSPPRPAKPERQLSV